MDLSSKIEDLRDNLQRSYRESLVMKLVNHDLEVDRDRLQHDFDMEVRRCQLEAEKMENDFNLKMENQQSFNDLEIETCKRKSNEIKIKSENIIERLEAEKAILAKIFSNKMAEVSDLKSANHEEMIAKKVQLDEEFAGRLSKIQDEHANNLAKLDLFEKKIEEDKKILERAIANEKKDNENRLKQQSQVFQKTLQDKIEEVNRKWGKEVLQFEQVRSWTEQALKNYKTDQAFRTWLFLNILKQNTKNE